VSPTTRTTPSFRNRFQPIEALPPGDQVVHLIDVYRSIEALERIGNLPFRFLVVSGPDFGRDDSAVAPTVERSAEHALGLTVHRRRIEEADPGLESGIGDDLTAIGNRPMDVKCLPCPHSDDRHM
jgi:hypothetical protein